MYFSIITLFLPVTGNSSICWLITTVISLFYCYTYYNKSRPALSTCITFTTLQSSSIFMCIPFRKYAKTHSFEWDDRRLTLEFTSKSSKMPFSKEFSRTKNASVDFVSVVPDRRSNMNPRVKWLDSLQAFENVESTMAWRGISNHLDSITEASQLSHDAREFVLRAVKAEVKNEYEKTVLIKNYVMAVKVTVRVMAIASEEEEGNSSSPEMPGRLWDKCGLCGKELYKQEAGLDCGHAFHMSCYH